MVIGSDDALFQYIDEQPPPNVPCLGYCRQHPGIPEKNYEKYQLLRRALYEKFGWKYVTHMGKINDQALLAMIRRGEFGISGTIGDSKAAYDESMEALANQYYSTYAGNHEAKCYGSCTLAEQLLWLQLIESFRKTNNNAKFYINDAGVIGYDEVEYIVSLTFSPNKC